MGHAQGSLLSCSVLRFGTGIVTLATCAFRPAKCETHDEPPRWTQARQAEVRAAARSCLDRGHPIGPEFSACVDNAVWPTGPRHFLQEHLETLRNFSCASNDTGTPPIFTMNVTLESGYAACPADGPAANPTGKGSYGYIPLESEIHQDFSYLPGVLPAGNDLPSFQDDMTAEEAANYCASLSECQGFTFSAESPMGPAYVHFKSTVESFRANVPSNDPKQPWHTYRRRRPGTCAAQTEESTVLGRAMLGSAPSFTVEVVREKPLVAIIRNFASADECDEIVRRSGDWSTMARARVFNGGISRKRQSYQFSIKPNLLDSADMVTSLISRMFALTRNLTGFAVYPPGQEPLNVVLYRDVGDEYRPHCDGGCHGRSYERGERIATSILYCRIPELGGATTFTNDALKVVPRSGDMLLFAYWLGGNLMAGQDGEHSGCPILKGQKLVATQWYREGVDVDWNWEAMADLRGSQIEQ